MVEKGWRGVFAHATDSVQRLQPGKATLRLERVLGKLMDKYRLQIHNNLALGGRRLS